MPGYGYTTKPSFKPFGFDDMAKPLLMYKEQYDKDQEATIKLADDVGAIMSLLDPELDTDSYAAVSDYQNRLQQQAAMLDKGLTPASRKQLFDLRKRYVSDVGAVQAGLMSREEDRKFQREMYERYGNSIMFSTDAYSTSVDQYLNGHKPDTVMFNGEAAAKDAMEQTAAVNSRYLQTEEGKLFNNQYNDLITRVGYNQPGVTMAQLLNETYTDANGETHYKYQEGRDLFLPIIDQVANKHGLSAFDENGKRIGMDWIIAGMDKGWGYKEDHKPLTNIYAKPSSGNNGGGDTPTTSNRALFGYNKNNDAYMNYRNKYMQGMFEYDEQERTTKPKQVLVDPNDFANYNNRFSNYFADKESTPDGRYYIPVDDLNKLYYSDLANAGYYKDKGDEHKARYKKLRDARKKYKDYILDDKAIDELQSLPGFYQSKDDGVDYLNAANIDLIFNVPEMSYNSNVTAGGATRVLNNLNGHVQHNVLTNGAKVYDLNGNIVKNGATKLYPDEAHSNVIGFNLNLNSLLNNSIEVVAQDAELDDNGKMKIQYDKDGNLKTNRYLINMNSLNADTYGNVSYIISTVLQATGAKGANQKAKLIYLARTNPDAFIDMIEGIKSIIVQGSYGDLTQSASTIKE